MIRIVNELNNRSTDYSKPYLAREARYVAKHAPESDGKVRGWYVHISEHAPAGARIALVVDYLTPQGEPRSIRHAI